MVWAYMQNTRMFQAFEEYGDRLDTVGLFTFEVDASGTLTESGTSISRMQTYINKWPHIKWLLTVMNNGLSSVFTALRNNTDGAQNKFLSELVRIMKKYPWCAGVDIDLERGGGYENKDAANALFQKIYQTVKAYDSTKLVNVCLPGMTGVRGSVGGENWCVYADIDPYCDTMAIMSYGEAWAGSAPGPTSSRDWLVGIYDYATANVPPEKIFMGLPGYGWEWQIYDTPENLNKTYRAISLTYYGALGNMCGDYHYADSQPYIPFFSYWDDYNHVPWGLLNVYDYADGPAADDYEYPLMADTYNRRRYLTAYSALQKVDFGEIYTELTNGMIFPNSLQQNSVRYRFSLPQKGAHISVKICFPIFSDDNKLKATLSGIGKGSAYLVGEYVIAPPTDIPSYTWPYYRSSCWVDIPYTDITDEYEIAEYELDVKYSGSGIRAEVYGMRASSNFEESRDGGAASFILRPREFKDIHGDMVGPANGFKLTCEMLRRKPDSALIWYDNFQSSLTRSYCTTLEGSWEYNMNDKPPEAFSIKGYGKFALNYSGFGDLHIRGRVKFPTGCKGRAGVFYGNKASSIFCCFNIDSQQIELYQDDTLKGYYSVELETDTEYTIEMRYCSGECRVYSGAGSNFRFKSSCYVKYVPDYATPQYNGHYAGIMADWPDKSTLPVFTLLRIGDGNWYEPYEAFDVEFPNGTRKSFGRIERSGVEWNEKYGIFKILNKNMEEADTRTEEISMSYDFFHSEILTDISCGGDYAFKIIPKDINIWLARLYLGDADGFGIMYYQDADSLIYWANQAAYHWKMRGFALWSLGQEDMALWEMLPKQISK